MYDALMKLLFGCSHRRTTFPLTVKGNKARRPQMHETYVVCLDCGKEFPYSWEEMRVLPAEGGSSVSGVREPVSTFSVSK